MKRLFTKIEYFWFGRAMIMERLKGFVERVSESIGCYYHLTGGGLYSLKKFESDQKGQMGVFGWVRELKRGDLFRIETYEGLGDRAGVRDLADEVREGMHIVSKKKDPDGKGTRILFNVGKGSHGEDYQKAVRALRAIKVLN
jgi:hypothetical protein